MDIEVKYSLGHDVGNYYNALYKFRWLKHGRDDLQKKLLKPLPEDFKRTLKKARDEQEAKGIIRAYLLKNLDKKSKFYTSVARDLEKAWKKKRKLIQEKLSDLYDNPLPFKKVSVYLTSLPINPYKYPDWILVYAEMPTKRQLEVLTHELNHFMFYHYFDHLKGKLEKEKFESLKEALTVFTNPEETGYPAQKKLRAWLKKQKTSIPEIVKKGEWKRYLGMQDKAE